MEVIQGVIVISLQHSKVIVLRILDGTQDLHPMICNHILSLTMQISTFLYLSYAYHTESQ